MPWAFAIKRPNGAAPSKYAGTISKTIGHIVLSFPAFEDILIQFEEFVNMIADGDGAPDIVRFDG